MSVNEEPLSSGSRRCSSSGDSVVGSTSAIPNKKAAFDSHYNQASATKNNGGQQIKKSPPSAHKGCSFCILDIEKAPIPELPSNEEVIGVITTEDVIKELLQEEILDGTDEYVKIHYRGSDQVSFLLFASVASTYEICEAME